MDPSVEITDIISKLETHASAVVDTIRRFVDTLRDNISTKQHIPVSVDFFEKLHSLSVRTLLHQWEEIKASNVRENLVRRFPKSASSFSLPVDISQLFSEYGPTTPNMFRDDSRRSIVTEILLPTIYLLAEVYALLDLIPQQSFATTLGKPLEERRSINKDRPTPPPGMLSIQNYTDIAALLEFTICTSVLPLLDKYVLISVQDRAEYSLPKSLQGRLPRPCLLWTTFIDAPEISPLERWYELQFTATVVGRLVQLDRFRPMLLPRHIADFYACVWQAQHLALTMDATVVAQNHTLWKRGSFCNDVLERLIPLHSESSGPRSIVDDNLLALTCQKLLLHGRKSPAWIQRKVSEVLQALAYRNLAALIVVFCPQHQQQELTAASLRLARTVLTGPLQQLNKLPESRQVTILQPIIDQLAVVLDQVADNAVQEPMATATWTEAHRTKIHTVWAMLNSLPDHVLRLGVLPRLSDAFVTSSTDKQSTDAHRAVRRWTALLVMIPPFVQMQRFLKELLLTRYGEQEISLIQLLIMFACEGSVLHTHITEDSIYALQLWSQAVLTADFGVGTSSVDVFSLALLSLLIPLTSSYQISVQSSEKGLDLVSLLPYKETWNRAQTLGAIERRAKFAVDKLVRPLSQASVSQKNTALPAHLLQVLVELYLSFGNNRQPDGVFPSALLSTGHELVTMTLLPVLCEGFPLETLLADPSSSMPLLQLIGRVLRTISLQINTNSFTSAPPDATTGFDSAARVVVSIMSLNETEQICEERMLDEEEFKFSICSILLNLLVGLLELGVERRSSQEELVLQSFSPFLTILADTSTHTSCDGSAAALLSGLSELASHANALISARFVSSRSSKSTHATNDPLVREFLLAKEDLQSTEAPVRARGVVALRHLVFASSDTSEPLLVHNSMRNDFVTLDEILCLSLVALADKESYVYLAAIQTIALAAIQDPSHVVRGLCVALATGVFRHDRDKFLSLSDEQRIKLSEALIAFVRRRVAMAEHLDDILGTLLFAAKRSKNSAFADLSDMIQIQTHRYFLGNDRAGRDEDEEQKSNWEEMDLRVSTGGPVFDSEEGEVVRSGAILLVAEVVRFASPAILVRFIPVLIECAKVSLQLEASRPLRRAGAFLASTLYDAVLREMHDQSPESLSKHQLECPFAVGMVLHDEASLETLLSRVEAGQDLSDLDAQKGRGFDPGTIARCREALASRKELEDTGLLALVRLNVSSRKQHPKILLLDSVSPASQDGKPLISIAK